MLNLASQMTESAFTNLRDEKRTLFNYFVSLTTFLQLTTTTSQMLDSAFTSPRENLPNSHTPSCFPHHTPKARRPLAAVLLSFPLHLLDQLLNMLFLIDSFSRQLHK